MKPAKERGTSNAKGLSMAVVVLCGVLLAVEIVVLPGAASMFRLVKTAVAVAGLASLVAICAARSMRSGGLELPHGPFALTLIALPVLQALSILWSTDPGRSLDSALTSAVWVAAALWIGTLSDRARKAAALWATIGVSLSAIVIAFQAGGIRILGVTEAGTTNRVTLTGLTGNPADLAMAAVLLLPLTLDAIADSPRRWVRWGLPTILVLATGVSKTLTGFAALGLIALVFIVRRRSARLWATATALAVAMAVTAMATGILPRMTQQYRQALGGDWYSLLSARWDGWSAALEMVERSPVTGIGAAAYTVDFYPARLAWLEKRQESGRRGEAATHFDCAHCDPLQMVAELGVPGLIWMVILNLALWRSRPRGDPVVPAMLAAAAPFAILHYPFHLAVGVLPLVLAGARVVATEPRRRLAVISSAARTGVLLLAVCLALATVLWQTIRVATDVWQGAIVATLYAIDSLPPDRRPIAASRLEYELTKREAQMPSIAPWITRKLGHVRSLAGDNAGAEAAYRESMEAWPHAETELGLAVVLARQGRRDEAMLAIGHVCRVNPELTQLIPDSDLRSSAEELVAIRLRAGR